MQVFWSVGCSIQYLPSGVVEVFFL